MFQNLFIRHPLLERLIRDVVSVTAGYRWVGCAVACVPRFHEGVVALYVAGCAASTRGGEADVLGHRGWVGRSSLLWSLSFLFRFLFCGYGCRHWMVDGGFGGVDLE